MYKLTEDEMKLPVKERLLIIREYKRNHPEQFEDEGYEEEITISAVDNTVEVDYEESNATTYNDSTIVIIRENEIIDRVSGFLKNIFGKPEDAVFMHLTLDKLYRVLRIYRDSIRDNVKGINSQLLNLGNTICEKERKVKEMEYECERLREQIEDYGYDDANYKVKRAELKQLKHELKYEKENREAQENEIIYKRNSIINGHHIDAEDATKVMQYLISPMEYLIIGIATVIGIVHGLASNNPLYLVGYVGVVGTIIYNYKLFAFKRLLSQIVKYKPVAWYLGNMDIFNPENNVYGNTLTERMKNAVCYELGLTAVLYKDVDTVLIPQQATPDEYGEISQTELEEYNDSEHYQMWKEFFNILSDAKNSYSVEVPEVKQQTEYITEYRFFETDYKLINNNKKQLIKVLSKCMTVENIEVSLNERKHYVDVLIKHSTTPTLVLYEEVEKLKKDNNYIVLGKSDTGFIRWDYNTYPHGALIGTTGTGKSVTINNIIAQLMTGKKERILYFADFKGGVEFNPFADFGNYTVIDQVENFLPLLENIRAELDKRNDLLKTTQCKKIAEYNALGKGVLPEIWLFVDELAEITTLKKEISNEVYSYIQSITALGRATGIFMIVATQTPMAKFFGGDTYGSTVRANLKLKMSGKSEKAYDLLFDGVDVNYKDAFYNVNEDDDNAILGLFAIAGHGTTKKTVELVKTPYISNEDLFEIIKTHPNEYVGYRLGSGNTNKPIQQPTQSSGTETDRNVKVINADW